MNYIRIMPLITFALLFSSLFCMKKDIDVHEGNETKIIAMPSPNMQMGETSQNKSLWPYKWEMCPNPYEQWSCKKRSESAFTPAAFGCYCLLMREMGALLSSCDHPCSEVHEIVWCSKNLWLPCLCDTYTEKFVSIVGNGITTGTFGSILVALCMFAPWFKKNGLNCCEKREEENDKECIELDQKK